METTKMDPDKPVYQDAPRLKQWGPDDLDRCEHGRHSVDRCFDCGGPSSGNLFLLRPHSQAAYGRRVRTHADGRVEVRIGTMVHGEPIWVVAQNKPRETFDSIRKHGWGGEYAPRKDQNDGE